MPRSAATPSDDTVGPLWLYTMYYDHVTGYQLRPVSAAATSVNLSLITKDHYNNNAGAHGQFHHPGPAAQGFGISQTALEELYLSMDEEDQDYATHFNMSQAGTLTSQTGA